ncbi:MAG: hypothetical protein BWZ03_00086 [bacterium ADurb.BinA186]|nr:MAG: hypothetical protein BWZ03_00086 [bacterium ADurb.BinA186]
MAGTPIPPVRGIIYIEGARFRSAVSEELIQRLGATNNFISLYQYDTKDFFLNGPYSSVSTPQTAVDGLYVFPFDVEIFDAVMFNIVSGSSGTTELDIKYATAPGGSFTSIFSTTPKITSAAGDYAWIGVGGSLTGATAPVFTSTPASPSFNVDAGWAVRIDLLQSQAGAQNCGLLLYFRPR